MKFLIVLSLMLSSFAFADQCAWTDRAIAARGVNLIKALADMNGQKPSVYLLCEPCGEKELQRLLINADKSNVSGLDITYKYAEMNGEKDKTNWEVTINGKSSKPQSIDLAYVFVKTAKDMYANVATLVNCPVSDVSATIFTGKN